MFLIFGCSCCSIWMLKILDVSNRLEIGMGDSTLSIIKFSTHEVWNQCKGHPLLRNLLGGIIPICNLSFLNQIKKLTCSHQVK
jgi:hypothetical protein